MLRLEALQQAPGGQGRADQVAHASLGEFGQRNDAEELLGEQRQLGKQLSVYVLCQRRLQLLLEIGLAGSGEERHEMLHLACRKGDRR